MASLILDQQSFSVPHDGYPIQICIDQCQCQYFVETEKKWWHLISISRRLNLYVIVRPKLATLVHVENWTDLEICRPPDIRMRRWSGSNGCMKGQLFLSNKIISSLSLTTSNCLLVCNFQSNKIFWYPFIIFKLSVTKSKNLSSSWNKSVFFLLQY